MKVLVTGGTGFLGGHLLPRLVQAGHHVRALARSAPQGADAKAAGVEWLRGDLQDREAVRRALVGVEVLYHLAGFVSFRPEDGRKMYALHVDCTRELLRDAREAGIRRLVLASTSGTLAVSKEPRVGTEEDDYPLTVIGRWPYYLSKVYEEKLTLEFCRRHDIPLVVLNPSLLFGPGDERLSSTWTVLKFLNQEIPALPGGGISFVDVRDVADAFVAALDRGELGGRHLMGVNLSMADFFARLSRLTGIPAPKVSLPSTLNVMGAHLLERWARAQKRRPTLDPQEVEMGEHWFWCDSAKAERLLGFQPRDPQQTLFDTVQDLLQKLPPGQLPGVKGRLAELRQRGR